MSVHDAAIIAIVAGIPVLLLLSRTHAALSVLALFAGATLARTVGSALVLFINGLVDINGSITDAVAIGLLVIPALVLAVHYRKSAGSKLLIQLLPIALSGATTLFLLIPIVSSGTQKFLTKSKLYPELTPYTNVVLSGAIVVSMLVCVAMYKRAHDHNSKHSKH